MKKKLCKQVAVGLAALLAAGTLAGCGSDGNEASGNAQGSSESKQEESKSESTEESKDDAQGSGERMTISVIGIDWGYGPQPNSEMEQAWEDWFDVNLEVEWVSYNDYDQKVNSLIQAAAKDPSAMPDVIQVSKMANGSYYYPIFTQAVDAGLFVDMTPYLFNNGNGIAETNAVMKNWDDSFWAQAKHNDGIYILPRSKSEAGQNSGINVRRDLMKKYGYEEEPKTMDELKDWLIGLSNAATEGEGQKIYAMQFVDDGKNKFMGEQQIKAYAIAFVGQTDWAMDENGEFQYMQFKDEYLDFLNWMKDLYDAKVIDPEFALNNEETSKWKGGNSVSYLTAWYNWNQSADLTSNKIFDKSTPDTLEAWCLMPVQGPKAYTVCPNYTDIDSCIAINSACDEAKIAKIMEVFNGTEEATPGYDLMMSDGVEGIHYTLLEDGTKDTSGEGMGDKRQAGYVGAWNQIFLKIDADQVVGKFMRSGAKAASEECLARAKELKKYVSDHLAETGMTNETQNLQSETYNNSWQTVVDDVDSMCAQYVMGQINEQQWKDFVAERKASAEYKAIQAEFKASYEASK